MSNKKRYWKGIEDLNNSPSLIKSAQSEFAEEVPMEKFLGESNLGQSSTPRRDFLKFLGFSVTAASLAACETPVRNVIPYVFKPEEITPGVANWYASSYYDGNDYCSILVKTREGRPIKIEGNKLSGITKGGTSARVQASVLSLYDSARLTGPTANGNSVTWDEADKAIGSKLDGIVKAGGNVRILTSSIISPSVKKIVADFAAKYTNVKHISYDAVSYSAIIKANQESFGTAVIPTYMFDKASVIVGFAADFLSNWVSPIEHAKQYSKTRKVSKEKAKMSRHYQFETNLSITGSNADVREALKPSQVPVAIVNLYNAIAKMAGKGAVASKALEADKQVAAAAKELWENKGKSLVVCGLNDIASQTFVNAINAMLGNYGNTINLDIPDYTKQGDDAEVAALLDEMKGGKVGALFMYNVNPAYTMPASWGFADALKKVSLTVSFADRADETASLCQYVCPDHHYLESWGDANPRKGHYSLVQPTIFPLFNTRAFAESMLKWSGNNSTYQAYVKNFWRTNVFPYQSAEMSFENYWVRSLHDGVVELPPDAKPNQKMMAAAADTTVVAMAVDTTMAAEKEEKGLVQKVVENVKEELGIGKDEKGAKGKEAAEMAMPETFNTNNFSKDLSDAAGKISKASGSAGAFEIALYEKAGIGNGNQTNNPWLLEMPDPISRVTWDNYLTMSPKQMEELKLETFLEKEVDADLVDVTVNGVKLTVPVYPQPGQAYGTVGLALGYGRTKAGKAGNDVGKNAYEFVSISNGTMMYGSYNAQVSASVGKYPLAATQTHHTLMGRNIVKETTLEEYKKDPAAGNEKEYLSIKNGHEHTKVEAEKVDLWATEKYAGFDKPGNFWNMSIDLNSCIGCGACVIGCQSENNVAVVGKDQVRLTREMHWLRIDRYYSSDMKSREQATEEGLGAVAAYKAMEIPSENPQVVFQPMLCQHCNHAPCETVCPVIATSHSNEGLNQMTYNRCLGTKYCANNCPYKVRRFNWYRYTENPRFDFNMNDTLGKMVLNPDVVVRTRGVMEKCTMCIQRIQEGKLNAKRDGRRIKDGEIQTACAQACPTDAIIFGNANDKESMVSKSKEDERMYHVLAELDVQPSVFYLTKVRNTEGKAEA